MHTPTDKSHTKHVYRSTIVYILHTMVEEVEVKVDDLEVYMTETRENAKGARAGQLNILSCPKNNIYKRSRLAIYKIEVT